MPANKSHHFVPRFYLRYFTPESKRIDLFNIASNRLIRGAPLKGQCCRDYFYGKVPEHEKGIADAEGQTAELFRLIFRHHRLPVAFTSAHVQLCFHLVTQAFRTLSAADALSEMVDGFWKEVLKNDPRAKGQLDAVRIGFEDPALVAVGHAMQVFSLLMDLETRLLLVPRGSEFITSDNPVVMYNKFLVNCTLGSTTGLASKGLAVFFPICPILTLVMYDKDVYHFGQSKAAPIAQASVQDVFELNVPQAASASENVYLNSAAANIFRVVEKARPFRRTRLSHVEVVSKSTHATGHSELIHTTNEDLRTDAQLSFLRVHKHAARWLQQMEAQRFRPAAFVRNEQYISKFRQHDRAVKAGHADYEGVIEAIFGRKVDDKSF